MKNIDKNTPVGALTVGQLLEILSQMISETMPEYKPKEEPKEDRVGIDEISELTGLSKSALYKMTMDNKIPHRSFGRRLVFSRTEVLNWMEQQTKTKITRKQKAARRLAKLAAKRAEPIFDDPS